MWEWLGGPIDRARSDAFIDRCHAQQAEHGFSPWAVVDRATGDLAGFVGLLVPRFDPPFAHAAEPCVEIGWRLGAAFWGRGFATEAGSIVLEQGFTVLGLPEIVAFTVPDNARSRAVMVRLGMTHDPASDFDHPLLPADHPQRRHVLYRR